MRELLSSGRYPARNPEQNVADLKAQIAANEKGVQEIGRMIEHYGLDVVHAYMKHVQDNAEEHVRRVLDVLKDGRFRYPMDDGRSGASTKNDGARSSISPRPAPSSRRTSTRPVRCAVPRCSTCFVRWSMTRSR